MIRATSIRGTSLLAVGLLLTLACGAPGASVGPSPSQTTSPGPSIGPSPSVIPSGEVSSAAQAAALVFASDARFARMQPLRPDMIGQSAWFEATDDGDGFRVVITFGAGDCMAGCMERHTFSYSVSRTGEITLIGDEGDDVPIPPAEGTGGQLTLHVSLVAGPICPVVQNPPDPSCDDRPVVNAEVVVYDADDNQVAAGTSDADGNFLVQLPAGAYYAVPQAVDGLLGQAAPLAFAGVDGDEVALLFGYDTGIR